MYNLCMNSLVDVVIQYFRQKQKNNLVNFVNIFEN